MGRILRAMLALSLACCLVPCEALADAGEYTSAGELLQPAGVTAQAAKTSATSKWVVKTKEYQFAIPKYWRGKVQWKTTSYRWQNNVGKWRKSYTTTVYLKGHKGENDYALLRVGFTTGFNTHMTPLVTIPMKRQDHPQFRLHVTALAYNYPYLLWLDAHGDTSWKLSIPVKDRKALLKLSTGNKVSYKAARKSADYGTRSYKAVTKYLKPYFKKSLKVLV